MLLTQEVSGSHPGYAVQVRPRYERIIASTLPDKGYGGFLPLYRCRRRWSDRIKETGFNADFTFGELSLDRAYCEGGPPSAGVRPSRLSRCRGRT
jgi:hypothetical protein